MKLGLLYPAIAHSLLVSSSRHSVAGHEKFFCANSSFKLPGWTSCTVLHHSSGLIDNRDETVLP